MDIMEGTIINVSMISKHDGQNLEYISELIFLNQCQDQFNALQAKRWKKQVSMQEVTRKVQVAII